MVLPVVNIITSITGWQGWWCRCVEMVSLAFRQQLEGMITLWPFVSPCISTVFAPCVATNAQHSNWLQLVGYCWLNILHMQCQWLMEFCTTPTLPFKHFTSVDCDNLVRTCCIPVEYPTENIQPVPINSPNGSPRLHLQPIVLVSIHYWDPGVMHDMGMIHSLLPHDMYTSLLFKLQSTLIQNHFWVQLTICQVQLANHYYKRTKAFSLMLSVQHKTIHCLVYVYKKNYGISMEIQLVLLVLFDILTYIFGYCFPHKMYIRRASSPPKK